MTATATAPPRRHDAASSSSAAGPPSAHPADRWLLPAEILAAAVGLVVVLGMVRLLEGPGFLGPVLAAWAVVVVGTAVARRRGWGLLVTAPVLATAVIVLLGWLVLPGETLGGIPTPETLSVGLDAIVTSWSSFDDVTAPAPPDDGFVLSAALGAAIAAFLADWAAFRIWSAAEAVVPWLTLFVFTAMLGSDEGQQAATVAFGATVLGFVLLHRVASEARRGSWLTTDVSGAARAMVRAGAVLGVAGLLAGVLLSPGVPGVDDEPLVSWRGADAGGGQRVTISPLVEIRSRLVDQADVEMFTVEATEPAYWRLTSLDTFEDDIWRSSGRYRAVDGALPDPGTGTDGAVVEVEQAFTIQALSALWLPAAYEPRAVTAPTEVRYHPDSATLIVDTDVPTSDGMSYRVSSLVPRHTPEDLRAAGSEIPADVAERYLPLPPDASPVAAELAREVTADTTNDYDRALALQNWFQSEFTYDLTVPAGHGDDAVADFLARRSGYCEQFAGTFALMARQLGIPARVAVGFTPGDPDPDDPRRYTVRGEYAHAWPEVYLGRYGWVSFEPTPGRGAPGAEEHTGLPAAQDTSGPAVTATTLPDEAAASGGATTTTPPGATNPTQPPVTLEPGAGGSTDEPAASGRSAPATIALVALVAVLGWVAIVPTALALRRRRRRSAATTPADRVVAAWTDSTEALAPLGVAPEPGQTASEWATEAGRTVPSVADGLEALAVDVDAVAFGPGEVTSGRAEEAGVVAGTVEREVSRRLGRWGRLRRALDPRPLLRR